MENGVTENIVQGFKSPRTQRPHPRNDHPSAAGGDARFHGQRLFALVGSEWLLVILDQIGSRLLLLVLYHLQGEDVGIATCDFQRASQIFCLLCLVAELDLVGFRQVLDLVFPLGSPPVYPRLMRIRHKSRAPSPILITTPH